MANLRKLWRTI